MYDESNRQRVHLDRRASPRAEYRRTVPGLLELGRFHCAVRDLGVGGLRVEPAPLGRVWLVSEPVAGELVLRAGGRVAIEGWVYRIDRAGLAIVPRGDRWPTEPTVGLERAALLQGKRERRHAPRLPFPAASNVRTPLRDVSAMGLRYALAPGRGKSGRGDAPPRCGAHDSGPGQGGPAPGPRDRRGAGAARTRSRSAGATPPAVLPRGAGPSLVPNGANCEPQKARRHMGVISRPPPCRGRGSGFRAMAAALAVHVGLLSRHGSSAGGKRRAATAECRRARREC